MKRSLEQGKQTIKRIRIVEDKQKEKEKEKWKLLDLACSVVCRDLESETLDQIKELATRKREKIKQLEEIFQNQETLLLQLKEEKHKMLPQLIKKEQEEKEQKDQLQLTQDDYYQKIWKQLPSFKTFFKTDKFEFQNQVFCNQWVRPLVPCSVKIQGGCFTLTLDLRENSSLFSGSPRQVKMILSALVPSESKLKVIKKDAEVMYVLATLKEIAVQVIKNKNFWTASFPYEKYENLETFGFSCFRDDDISNMEIPVEPPMWSLPLIPYQQVELTGFWDLRHLSVFEPGEMGTEGQLIITQTCFADHLRNPHQLITNRVTTYKGLGPTCDCMFQGESDFLAQIKCVISLNGDWSLNTFYDSIVVTEKKCFGKWGVSLGPCIPRNPVEGIVPFFMVSDGCLRISTMVIWRFSFCESYNVG
jgi:hypothetical protein